jgi:ribosomal protein S18 acetylase RimI-like enzyme
MSSWLLDGIPLVFAEIDVSVHSSTCTEFRADSFLESFGTDAAFWGHDRQGDVQYLAWLQQLMTSIPCSCIHLWLGNRIIGQVEVGASPQHPSYGWIFLIYVAKAFRGRGIGNLLLQFAEHFLSAHGYTKMGLRVSPSNHKAIALYLSNSWEKSSQPSDSRELIVLEKKANLTTRERYYGQFCWLASRSTALSNEES